MDIVKKTFSLLTRLRWLRNKRVFIASSAIFKGFPLIEVEGGKLTIGEGVVINSWQRGYHLSMHSKARLYVEGSGASIEIGANTRIHASCIHATNSIRIGSGCLIAANCQIFDNSGHDADIENAAHRINSKGISKPITIENNVWLGTNVIVMPGVTIGEGSVIGAGSVVTKDIPTKVLAAGAPAKIIRPLHTR